MAIVMPEEQSMSAAATQPVMQFTYGLTLPEGLLCVELAVQEIGSRLIPVREVWALNGHPITRERGLALASQFRLEDI
jgi:hypothetical protein